jgi:hypothetical protein
MSKISEHYIGTANGHQNLIEWTAGAKHRYYPSFDTAEQLDFAKRIARVEDADARKLMLELLDTATRGANRIVEARKEFETINTALVKIDAQLSPENDEAWHPLPGAPLRFRLRFVVTFRIRLGSGSGLSSAGLFCLRSLL